MYNLSSFTVEQVVFNMFRRPIMEILSPHILRPPGPPSPDPTTIRSSLLPICSYIQLL